MRASCDGASRPSAEVQDGKYLINIKFLPKFGGADRFDDGFGISQASTFDSEVVRDTTAGISVFQDAVNCINKPVKNSTTDTTVIQNDWLSFLIFGDVIVELVFDVNLAVFVYQNCDIETMSNLRI